MNHEIPSDPKTETNFDSNYRKVMVAARRARQLLSGAPPLVASKSNKACRQAQDEILAGKIAFVQTGPPLEKPDLGDSGIPILAV